MMFCDHCLAYCMQGTEIYVESLQVVLGTCKTSCLTVIHFSSHLYLFISLVVLGYYNVCLSHKIILSNYWTS
jgi:hypothetical protein